MSLSPDGLKAVFKVDISKEDSPSRELVYADPENDINGKLLYSPKTGEVIGISHINGRGGQKHLATNSLLASSAG